MPTAREMRESLLAGRTPLQQARRAEFDALMGSDAPGFLEQFKTPGGAVAGLAALTALLSGEGMAAAEIAAGSVAGAQERQSGLEAQRQGAILSSLEQFYQQANTDADRAARMFGAQPDLFLESAPSDAEANLALNADQSLTLRSGYNRLKAQAERKEKAAAVLNTYRGLGGEGDSTQAGRKILMSKYNDLMGIDITEEELDEITRTGLSMSYFERVAINSQPESVKRARQYISQRILKDRVSSDDEETILNALNMLEQLPDEATLADRRAAAKDRDILNAYTMAEYLRGLPENRAIGMTIEQALDLLPENMRAVVRVYDGDRNIGEFEAIMDGVDSTAIVAEAVAAVGTHNTAAMVEYGSYEAALADGAILDPGAYAANLLHSAFNATRAYSGLFAMDMAGDITGRSMDAAATTFGFTSEDLQDNAKLGLVSARAGMLREVLGKQYDDLPAGSKVKGSMTRPQFVRTQLALITASRAAVEDATVGPPAPATLGQLISQTYAALDASIEAQDMPSEEAPAATDTKQEGAGLPGLPTESAEPEETVEPVNEDEVLPGLGAAMNEGLNAAAKDRAKKAALAQLDDAAKAHQKMLDKSRTDNIAQLKDTLSWTSGPIKTGKIVAESPADAKKKLLDMYVAYHAFNGKLVKHEDRTRFLRKSRAEMYDDAEAAYAAAIQKYGDKLRRGTERRGYSEDDALNVAREMGILDVNK